MKKWVFKNLSALNKAVLPKVWKTADLGDLSKREKLLLGWKRWVTLNYLDLKDKD